MENKIQKLAHKILSFLDDNNVSAEELEAVMGRLLALSTMGGINRDNVDRIARQDCEQIKENLSKIVSKEENVGGTLEESD